MGTGVVTGTRPEEHRRCSSRQDRLSWRRWPRRQSGWRAGEMSKRALGWMNWKAGGLRGSREQAGPSRSGQCIRWTDVAGQTADSPEVGEDFGDNFGDAEIFGLPVVVAACGAAAPRGEVLECLRRRRGPSERRPHAAGRRPCRRGTRLAPTARTAAPVLARTRSADASPARALGRRSRGPVVHHHLVEPPGRSCMIRGPVNCLGRSTCRLRMVRLTTSFSSPRVRKGLRP